MKLSSDSAATRPVLLGTHASVSDLQVFYRPLTLNRIPGVGNVTEITSLILQ